MPIQLGARLEHSFSEPLGLLSDCHRRIEHFLAILQKVRDDAAGQILSDEQRRAVEAALTYFRTAAPRHTQDEERSLFPLLRASKRPQARQALEALEALEHDHAAADSAHAEVESWYRRWLDTGVLTAPQRKRLRRVLGALQLMYHRHIEVEDRRIFPLAKEILSRKQIEQMGKEMADRRMVSSASINP